jgi:hypothetical protein
VSITALRDDAGELIGYLLIGADNSVRKQVEAKLNEALAAAENRQPRENRFSLRHEP